MPFLDSLHKYVHNRILLRTFALSKNNNTQHGKGHIFIQRG